jgi:hypothetical protein
MSVWLNNGKSKVTLEWTLQLLQEEVKNLVKTAGKNKEGRL